MWNASSIHQALSVSIWSPNHMGTSTRAFANCRPITHRKPIAMAGIIWQAFSLSLALVCVVNGHSNTFCDTKPGVPFDFYSSYNRYINCCHSFQLDHQVDISLYLTEAIALRHSREVAYQCLKPSWCTISPISLLASWPLKSIPFQVSHKCLWWLHMYSPFYASGHSQTH